MLNVNSYENKFVSKSKGMGNFESQLMHLSKCGQNKYCPERDGAKLQTSKYSSSCKLGKMPRANQILRKIYYVEGLIFLTKRSTYCRIMISHHNETF